jgi:hypothetical protein
MFGLMLCICRLLTICTSGWPWPCLNLGVGSLKWWSTVTNFTKYEFFFFFVNNIYFDVKLENIEHSCWLEKKKIIICIVIIIYWVYCRNILVPWPCVQKKKTLFTSGSWNFNLDTVITVILSGPKFQNKIHSV